MHGFWERDVIDPGKLPLLICFAAFVITFLTTRAITRGIRAGRGPFHNISDGGTHIHHSVPGIILLVAGAFLAVDSGSHDATAVIAAGMVGIGTSLVLDEFALILHLTDDYWTAQGRVSVEMVSLAAGCLGFMLVGAAPFGVHDMGVAELSVRIGATAASAVTLAAIVVCVFKGKLRFALFGIFVPPLAWVGAVRLARPDSRWERRFYGPDRRAVASRRTTDFDARWDPMLDRISNLIAGAPSPPASGESAGGA